MVVGATSGAGKSTVTAAICRQWARSGCDVAPFKGQNMSNHTAVTPDGGEIGRAQAMQALAAGVDTDRRMNPVLLKPSGDRTSHLVVLGEEVSTTDAVSYGAVAAGLRPVVLQALTSLRGDHDWVVAEGAGGAAEVNLLDRDLVNLPLAAAAGIPAILVVDIDRGGAFAAAHGTVDLLPPRLRRQVRGIVINRFRGDPSLLDGGLSELTRRTGVPVLGVLPHLGEQVMLGVEPADLDPLALEPDVDLRWVTRPEEVLTADLVVLPGSRATVADLGWLHERGLAAALRDTRSWVLGLCAGYQLLGTLIHDDLESRCGTVPGLGLLPVETTFCRPKTVTRSSGPGVSGYQIRWGRPVSAGTAWLALEDGPEGCVDSTGRVRGTSLHGVLDEDALRAGLLGEVARARDRVFTPGGTPYAVALEQHLDHLADWLGEHVDVDGLRALAATAATPGGAPGW